MKKILIVTIISSLLTICCASIKLTNNDTYSTINLSLERILEQEKDTVYLRKKGSNEYFKTRLNENKELSNRFKNNSLKNIFLNDKEIKHLREQLENSFRIDFKKINSKYVKEYIKPNEKKNEEGYFVQTKESLADLSKIKYTFSSPILTFDKNYSFIMVSKDKAFIAIYAFKIKDGEMTFLESILLGMA